MAAKVAFTSADVARLVPGDCLLYSSGGPLPWLIKLKTWSPVSHVEVYRGVANGVARSIAARQAGVNTYPVRLDGVYEVLRPDPSPLDLQPAVVWFDVPFNKATGQGVTGQRYDVLGLFRFFTLGSQSTEKQFCSEVATRFYRRALTHDGRPFCPFAADYDADLVSPGMFRASTQFVDVWTTTAGWDVPPAP